MIRKVNESKADVWRDRFRRFSGLEVTVQKFCDSEHVSMANFYYWRSRLAGDAKPAQAKSKPPVFQTVTVTPPGGELIVRFPGDIQMEIPSTHPEAIRTVVSELARAQRAANNDNPSC